MLEKDITANSILLDEMLKCNTDCSAGNFKTRKFFYEEDAINWLFRNLPTANYVVNQIVNFIFSNGLTTGDDAQDEKLNEFLYKKNIIGTTNFSVIQEAVKNALIYSKSGIRYVSDEAGIINVHSRTYACITAENEEYYGFKDTFAYIIAADGRKIYETEIEELDFDKETFIRTGIVIDKIKKILIISKEDFVNLRMNTSIEDGESLLSFDVQRTKLLTTIYERLNYDIEYDGPGRLLFKLKKGYGDEENEASTSIIVNQTNGAKVSRVNKAKKEAEGIAKDIKNSSSDNVILVSDIFEDFEHLPRTTKATEFLKYIEEEGSILSQVFGIPPQLLGLGKISGNVSMEKIIDNAMLNAIIPIREKFAVQISALLAPKLGVEKIYFDKYEVKQAVDENDKRIKVVDMIDKLVKAGYTSLADKIATMLDKDVSDPNMKLLKIDLMTRINRVKKILIGGKNE